MVSGNEWLLPIFLDSYTPTQDLWFTFEVFLVSFSRQQAQCYSQPVLYIDSIYSWSSCLVTVDWYPTKNYLHHSLRQQLGSEELQHGLHDILPALSEDVAMTMGQMEYCLGCNVSFRVASKHTGQVLNRLEKKIRRCLGSGMCLKKTTS